MDMLIKPSRLHGTVNIPASKSVAHRMLICSALADGQSAITGLNYSKDIDATIYAMSALGAGFCVGQHNSYILQVLGIHNVPEKAVIDCNESGSTLRFIIPVAMSK